MSPQVKPQTVVADTWQALAAEWGVAAPTVTRAVRSVYILRDLPLPGHIPGPLQAGPEIVEAARKIVFHGSSVRGAPPHQEARKQTKTELQSRIFDALDEHSKLLGDNLIETVARELKLPISDIREALKQRWEALKLERKILAEMNAIAQTEESQRQAHEAHKTRQAIEAAERAKPRAVAIAAPLLSEEPPPEASVQQSLRPKGFPERGENVSFDEMLRAAWIAMRAGLPDVLGRTAVAVEEVVGSEVTFADLEKAIEASYLERPEGARKTMERRAEKLKGEKT